MSEFKLEFTLRQHTPLIHFQHDQEGATLRATEVKAKLDKFLIARLTGEYGNEEARLKAMLGNENYRKFLKTRPGALKEGEKTGALKPALDYQMVIKIEAYYPEQEIKRQEPIERTHNAEGNLNTTAKGDPVDLNFPGFFGNMLTIEEKKDGKKPLQFALHQFVKVKIDSSNSSLISLIKLHINDFFLRTNFGMRQNKGFGSYYLHPKDIELFKLPNLEYAFDVDVKDVDAYKTPDKEFFRYRLLFQKMDTFYRTIRSGMNQPMYFKSLLWAYLKSNDIQWDKKTIKQTFFPAEESYQKEFDRFHKPRIEDPNSPLFWDAGLKQDIIGSSGNPTKSHLLWRDLLGLSTEQSWKSYKLQNLKKKFVSTDDSFNRVASPVFFKPIRTGKSSFRVFFEVPGHLKAALKEGKTSLPDTEHLGKTIEITFKGSQNSLKIPFPIQFDFDAFFHFAFNANLEKHVEKRYHDKDDFKTLKAIYSQLKAQIPPKNGQ